MSTAPCARARSVLPFYLEQEVDCVEAFETGKHLSACSGCAETADAGREVLRALRDLETPVPPRDFAGDVLSTLRRLRRRAADRGSLKWGSLGVLVAVIAFGWSPSGPGWERGLRLVEGLGELTDLDMVSERLVGLLSRLVPSPSSLVEGLLGTAGSVPGGAGPVAPHVAIAAFLLGALLATLLLSGVVLVGGVALAGPARRVGRRLRRLF